MAAKFLAAIMFSTEKIVFTRNMLTEVGGLVVGEDIKLHFDVQLIRQ